MFCCRAVDIFLLPKPSKQIRFSRTDVTFVRNYLLGRKNIRPKMNFFRKQFDSIPRSFFFTYFCIQVRNKLIYCFFEILMKTFRKKWSRKLERRISLTATFLLFHEQPGFERRTFFRPGLPLTTDRLKSFFFFVDFCSVRLNFL